jgi:YHS domain-containing protein
VQKDEARADVQMRTVVNNNLYYVCCPGCDVTSDPAGTLKKLVDPVTKKEFNVTAKSPRADYMGQIYYFAGPESKAEFGKSPEKYAVLYGK